MRRILGLLGLSTNQQRGKQETFVCYECNNVLHRSLVEGLRIPVLSFQAHAGIPRPSTRHHLGFSGSQAPEPHIFSLLHSQVGVLRPTLHGPSVAFGQEVSLEFPMMQLAWVCTGGLSIYRPVRPLSYSVLALGTG